MLFPTYVELDAATNEEIRTGCHLIVNSLSSFVSKKEEILICALAELWL